MLLQGDWQGTRIFAVMSFCNMDWSPYVYRVLKDSPFIGIVSGKDSF